MTIGHEGIALGGLIGGGPPEISFSRLAVGLWRHGDAVGHKAVWAFSFSGFWDWK